MIERGCKGVRGTTLAEVLVSLAFLATVSSAILASVVQGGKRIAIAQRRQAAQSLVCAEIARVRSLAKISSISAGEESATVVLPPSTSATLTRKTSAVAGYTNLFALWVSASWSEDGQARSVELSTLARNSND